MYGRFARLFGLTYFRDGEGGDGGGGDGAGTGSGSGSGTGTGTGSGSGTGGSGAGTGGGAPAAGTGTGEVMIPKARFDEVNSEYQRLKQAEEARQADEAKRKGEFEKVAEQEKQKRTEAEQRALAVGRRAAFIGALSTKLSDVTAAYKLAKADGLVDTIELDDDGEPKDTKAIEALAETLTKNYPFLKPGAPATGRGFGGDHGGAGAPSNVDIESMTTAERMEYGIRQAGKTPARSR